MKRTDTGDGAVRVVVVDAQAFVLERIDSAKEWGVYWADEPPAECHAQLGVLSWLHEPGATATTGLDIVNVDQVDHARKVQLLRRVAVAAGLTLRTRGEGRS